MLVADLPRREFQEPALRVGNFEIHNSVGSVANGAPHRLQERLWISEVIDDLAAADEVGLVCAVLLGVIVLEELDVFRPAAHVGVARIETHAAIAAQAADGLEEIAVAAPDIEHLLVAHVVALDQCGSEALDEGLVEWRVFGRYVVAAEFKQGWLEGPVADKAAGPAQAEQDAAARGANRLLVRWPQHAVLRGDVLDLEEVEEIRGAAHRADAVAPHGAVRIGWLHFLRHYEAP